MADQIAKLIFQADTKAITNAKKKLDELTKAADGTSRASGTATKASQQESQARNEAAEAAKKEAEVNRASQKIKEEAAKRQAKLDSEHTKAIIEDRKRTADIIKKKAAEEVKAEKEAAKQIQKEAKAKAKEQEQAANAVIKAQKKAEAEAKKLARAQEKAAAAAKKQADKLKKAEEAANKLSKAEKLAKERADKLSDALKRASNAAAVMTGPLGGVSGRLSFLATGVSRFKIGMMAASVAMAGLATIAGKSISAFADYETQMLKLEAITKATGHTAGFTAEQLDAMAVQVGRDTLASAAGVRDLQAVLLSFGNIQGDVFERAVNSSVDLSAVMGQTATSAAKTLAKALEDPVNNLTAMTRAGVTFTEKEKQKIKELAETNRLLDAQEIILTKLENKIGGAGAGGGLPAALDLLGENMINASVQLAKTTGIAEGAMKAANFIASIFQGIETTFKFFEPSELDRIKEARGEVTTLAMKIAAIQSIPGFGAELAENLYGEDLQNAIKKVTELEDARAQKMKDNITAMENKRDGVVTTEVSVETSQKSERAELGNQGLQVKLDEATGLRKKAANDAFRIAKRTAELDFKLHSDQTPLLKDELARKRDLQIEAAEQEREQKVFEFEVFQDRERIKTELIQAELLRRSGFAEEANAMEISALLEQNDIKFDLMEESYRNSEAGLAAHEANKQKIIADHNQKKQDADSATQSILNANQKKAFNQMKGLMGQAAQTNKKAFEVNKAMKIGEAIGDTYRAANSAYAALAGIPIVGPALGAAAAGVAVAAGMINVKAIKSTKFGGGGGGGAGGGHSSAGVSGSAMAGSAPVMQEQFVDNREAERIVNVTINDSIDPSGARRIVEALNEATEDGLVINALVA